MSAQTRTRAPKNKKIANLNDLTSIAKAKTMVKGSVEKVNRDLSVIRGITLKDAMNYLYFSRYSSAQPLAKLLKSAASNALNGGLVSEDQLGNLIINKIWANKSLQLKRMRAASKGKPSPRTKSYSWVYLELALPKQD